MIELNRGSRFIFVGGAPRSGTTLVQNMLDSHPDIFGGPEFIHIPDVIRLRKDLHGSITRGWIDLFCSHADVDHHICSLIENLLLPLANKHEGKLLSEKTPGNVLVFSELIDLFPGARFIHVVRDPRAIIASMLQVGKRAKGQDMKTAVFTNTLDAAMNYTQKCLTAGFAASQSAPNNILTIMYEQLVTKPERETKKICDFLSIAWSDRMMRPGSFQHLGEKAITLNSGQVWYNRQMYNRNPENHHIHKWKTQLTSRQQTTITQSFTDNNELAHLGYEFSHNGASRKNQFLDLASEKATYLTDYVLRRGRALTKMSKKIFDR